MSEIKFTVKMLAAKMNLSVAELEDACEIKRDHLKSVSQGRAKLTGYDVVQLVRVTGVPVERIEVQPS